MTSTARTGWLAGATEITWTSHGPLGWSSAGPGRAHPVGPERPLLGPVGEVYEVAFHPTRDELAVSSVDDTIRLWDLTAPLEPAAIGTLDAGDGLLTVTFTADGRRLAVGGRSGTTRLWHTEPDEATALICTAAGAPVTPEEWARFVPDQQYTPPCP